jgi:hypothetical protein
MPAPVIAPPPLQPTIAPVIAQTQLIIQTPPSKSSIQPQAPGVSQGPHFVADTSVSSAGNERGKATAGTIAAKVNGLVREGKNEEAMTVFNIYQHNLREFLSLAQFEQLKSVVDNAYTLEQNRRAKFRQIEQNIDDLVDQDRSAEAFNLFRAKREELRENINKDEFDRIETKVGRAVVNFGKAQGAANARAREIRALVSNQKIEEASSAFEESRVELQRCLSKDGFEQLRSELSSAINAIKDKKKQATLCIRDIRSLIDEGKGLAANAKFTENRPLLQQNLDEKSFYNLAMDVSKANGDFFARQARAQADLTRIDSLIACKRNDAAWTVFDQSKKTLRKDLADDKRFFELKDRVVKAHDEFSAKKKKAEQTAHRIESLIGHHEGREAHMVFRLDFELLKEFLEALRFKKIEDAQQRAYVDYESNVAAARLMAQDIDGLLTQKRVQQAYESYKKAQDLFDRYFDNDKNIDDLEKKVKMAWAEFQKRQRWALSFIRQIQWLMDHKQGDLAYAQFKKARPDLIGYIDLKQLSELDTATAHADRKFIEAKAQAEKNTSRIREFVDQKHFEEAYRLFKNLKSSLEQYLSETTFTNLRNEVTNAYDEYEGKKNKAQDYARKLKFLVGRKKYKEAYQDFQPNRAALKQYLSAQEYSQLEKMIAGKNAGARSKN